MDEPCSALDPIATAKIEELIQALKTQCTIVIVTHNMQQAGRVSDFTAFFYLGKLIEFGPTVKISQTPAKNRPKITSPVASDNFWSGLRRRRQSCDGDADPLAQYKLKAGLDPNFRYSMKCPKIGSNSR